MIIGVSILTYYKQGIKTIVKTDLSKYVCSKVLFQLGVDGLLYLVIFFFKKLNPTEYNYEIYYKELPVIIRCFE